MRGYEDYEDLDEYETEGEEYGEDEVGEDDYQEEDPKPTKEQLEYLEYRQKVKERLRRQSGSAIAKSRETQRKDNFGSFFGPSQPVIASRVLQEGKALLEKVQDLDSRNSSSRNVHKNRYGQTTGGSQSRPMKPPKAINPMQQKLQRLKDTRDYSFLLSDDAELSATRNNHLDQLSSIHKSEARSVHVSSSSNGGRQLSEHREDRRPISNGKDGSRLVSYGHDERKLVFRGPYERTASNGRVDRKPALNGRDERRPASNGRDERRPASNGRDERRPASNGRDERRPASNGRDERRPASNGRDERRSASNGQDERRSASNGRNERRTVSNGRDERRPASNGRDERRPISNGREDRRPTSNVQEERQSVPNGREEKRQVPGGREARRLVLNNQEEVKTSSTNGKLQSKTMPQKTSASKHSEASLDPRKQNANSNGSGPGRPVGQNTLSSRSHGSTLDGKLPASTARTSAPTMQRPLSSKSNLTASKPSSQQKNVLRDSNRAGLLPKQTPVSSKYQVNKPAKPMSSSTSLQNLHSKKRPPRPYADEEEEVGGQAISNMIRSMFGYNPNRYADDEDDSDMEAGFDDIIEEEKRSAKIGRQEDERELRLIEEEERRERMRREAKKRKLGH